MKLKANLLISRDLSSTWSDLWIWLSVAHWRTVNLDLFRGLQVIHSAGAKVHNEERGAGAGVCIKKKALVRGMQHRRKNSAEVRRGPERLVRRYAVKKIVQVWIWAVVRRAAKGPDADLRSPVTEKLRIFVGLYWWSCGLVLKYLLAAFYLLLQCSGFILLVLIFCLQHFEKFGWFIGFIRKLVDSYVLDDYLIFLDPIWKFMKSGPWKKRSRGL